MKRPNFFFEKKLWKKGLNLIAGCDEVGRGCFAGPVVAAACAFAPNSNFQIPQLRRGFVGQAIFNEKGEKIIINDSKKLTALQREKSAIWIKKNCLAWGIGKETASLINRIGMSKATRISFRRAISDVNSRLKARGGLKQLDFL